MEDNLLDDRNDIWNKMGQAIEKVPVAKSLLNIVGNIINKRILKE